MRAIAPCETVNEPSHLALSRSVIPNRMRKALSSSAAATLAGKAPTFWFGLRADGRNQAMRARQTSRRIKFRKRDMGVSSGRMELIQPFHVQFTVLIKLENKANYTRNAL